MLTKQSKKLFSDAELLDQSTITFDIVSLVVVKKASSLADQSQQASAGVVILGILLDVLGQFSDPVGQDSDLDFR